MDSSTPNPLERFLLQRIGKALRVSEDELLSVFEILRTLRGALNSVNLTGPEIFALQGSDESQGDPIDNLMAARLQTAMEATLQHTAREAGIETPQLPEIRVVSRGDKSADDVRHTLTEAFQVTKIMAHHGRGTLLVTDDKTLEESLSGTRLDDDATRSLRVFPDSAENHPDGSPEIVVMPGFDQLRVRLKALGHQARTRKDLVGELIGGKYRLVRKIGTGGFGSVYEAVDELVGARCAIKILHPSVVTSSANLEGFKDEFRRLTRLSHPNIVDWKNFDDDRKFGTYYMVMELLEGMDLEDFLQTHGRLPPRRAMRILLQILQALRRAHHISPTESILHLDLKPRNIFVLDDGDNRTDDRIKVIDFGIGQWVREDHDPLSDSPPKTLTRLTRRTTPTKENDSRHPSRRNIRRSHACTPEYSSPEHCAHMLEDIPDSQIHALDSRADLYSLGIIAFRILTDKLPFDSPERRQDWFRIHLDEQPRSVANMGIRIPKRLAWFVDKCLIKNRDDRWTSSEQACAALESIVHPPAWKQILKVACAIGIVAVAAVVAVVLREPLRQTEFQVKHSGTMVDRESPVFLRDGVKTVDLEASHPFSAARLELQGEKKLFDTWSFSPRANGILTLEIPPELASEPGTFLDDVVQILGYDERNNVRWRSSAFRMVYLGPKSWEIAQGGIVVRGLVDSTKLINPYEQKLEVTIGSPASVYLDDGKFILSCGKTSFAGILVPDVPNSSHARYEFDLDRLELVQGRNNLTLTALDRSGTRKTFDFVLDIVKEPLHIAPRLGDIKGIPFAYFKDKYHITQAPTYIFVRTNREAAIFGHYHDQRFGPFGMSGENLYRFPLAEVPNLDLSGAKPLEIEITISADDMGFVHHSEMARRRNMHRREQLLAFRFDPTRPMIELYRNGARLNTISPEVDPTPLFVSDHAVKLQLASRDDVPRFYIATKCQDLGVGRTVVLDSEPTPYDLRGSMETVEIDLPSDGLFEVTLRAWRVHGGPATVNSPPDLTNIYLLLCKSSPPSVQLSLEPSPILALQAFEKASLTVTVPDPGYESAYGTFYVPVKLQLKLWKAGDYPFLYDPLEIQSRHTIALADIVRTRYPNLDPPDGTYFVTVSGRDVAGNPLEDQQMRFDVSFRGPELRFTTPLETSGDAVWVPGEDNRLELRVACEDPNGVASVTCAVSPLDGSTPETVTLQPAQNGDRRQGHWIGSLPHPAMWSEVEVKLVCRAVDQLGDWEEKTLELTLPEYDPRYPKRLEVVFEPHEIGDMILIEGNKSGEYVFGGRIDEVETHRFREAKFPYDYWTPQDPRLSWEVQCKAGTIEPYYIDEHEVTCREYGDYLMATGTASDAALAELRLHRDFPVTGVSWNEANNYAAWAGKTLPTIVQWEFAMRGGRDYRPYGAFIQGSPYPTARDVNFATGELWPSLERGRDVSKHGVWNLSGNVQEWTSSPRIPNPRVHAKERLQELLNPSTAGRDTKYYVVGGSYQRERFDFSCRFVSNRRTSHDDLGFRCAVSAKAAAQRLRPNGNEPYFRTQE